MLARAFVIFRFPAALFLCCRRRWAGTRLRHLGPWIQSWMLDSMFAGVPDRSASDAWYLTGLEVEEATVLNKCLVGGAVDLFKCFDQVRAGAGLRVIGQGGMPDTHHRSLPELHGERASP